MSYYHEPSATVIDRRPTPLNHDGRLIDNPTEADYEAVGYWPFEVFSTPNGHARIDGTRRVEIDGGAAREVFDTETIEARDERVEAQRHAEQEAQTVQDIQSYGTLIGELATILAQFPGITQDMGYNDISDIMAAAAFGDASESERARLHALSSRADNLYARLQQAPYGGITGERLWREVAALQGGGH